jgi:hypothetical protein
MIRDLFNRIKSVDATDTSASASIRILGDRASGKTTYMAALARWPNSSPNSLVETVDAISEEAEELVQKARDILEQGLELEPTNIDQVDTLKEYSLRIILKPELSWMSRNAKIRAIDIYSKEYGGEFIDDVLKYGAAESNQNLNEYIQDCAQGTGILFLVDGKGFRRDPQCAQALKYILKKLDEYGSGEGDVRRFAFTINKCEVQEFWINRHATEKILKSRFPQTLSVLKQWEAIGGGEVEFFSASAFGTIGAAMPRPNYRDVKKGAHGNKSILKEPRFWKPFGLVAPIYWLCTGKHHPKLKED